MFNERKELGLKIVATQPRKGPHGIHNKPYKRNQQRNGKSACKLELFKKDSSGEYVRIDTAKGNQFKEAKKNLRKQNPGLIPSNVAIAKKGKTCF